MSEQTSPRWKPLSAIDRRVLGVLAEKAKTTPDAYPMTVNSICVGANQKSNRAPLMNLDADDVQDSLDRLRALGAVTEVIGSGRAAKFRHHFYEWLGVEKAESAVMIELLLRGAQTEGELRGRAARMEPIADVAALRPIVESLKSKGLVLSLSSPGRGHVVSHALYEPREMDKIHVEFASGAGPVADAPEERPMMSEPHRAAQPSSAAAANGELAALKSELAELRGTLEELTAQFHAQRQDLDHLKNQLGV